MADPNQNINLTNAEIRRTALETASIVEEALRSITESVADAFENALGNTSTVGQTLAKDLQRSFNSLGKTSKETALNLVALNNGLLKSKTVQDQINKRKAEELAAGTSLVGVLRAQGAQLANIDQLVDMTTGELKDQGVEYSNLNDAQKSLVTQYAEGLRYSQEQTRELEAQRVQANAIEEAREKSLGISSKVLKTLGKIKGLGDSAQKSQEKLNEYAEEYRKTTGSYPTKLQSFAKAIQFTAKSFKEGLLDPAVVFTFIIKAIQSASSKITDLQKAFGLTKSDATSISKELENQAILSNDVFITSKKLNQSFRDLSANLGFAADISGQTLETFTNLTQRLGFTNDEATRLTYLSKLQSKNTEDVLQNTSKNVVALNKQRGTSINIKDVFRDISTASAATTVSLGGSVNKLADASTKARQLGLSLGQVDRIAESLLDFQTSIENELAAELMTGKQINLEQARYYALTNQTAELTEEIRNNQEVIDVFASNNRLAQEATAKALGMSREELSKMVLQQQFAALSADKFREKFGEANYEQMQALSIGDKFKATLEKIQEIIGRIGYALEPIMSGFASLASSSTIVLTAVGALVGLSFARAIASLTTMAIQAGLLAAGSTAAATVLTGGLVIGGVLAALGLLAGAMADFKADDLYSEGGYGKRTLLTPEGAFRLNDRDDIIATTNPENLARPTSAGSNNITVAPAVLPPVYTRIELNGSAIGNATSKENYGVGKNIYAFGGRVDYSA
jgi:ribosomal protein L12E/L44/L45/RPP1/RPP2